MHMLDELRRVSESEARGDISPDEAAARRAALIDEVEDAQIAEPCPPATSAVPPAEAPEITLKDLAVQPEVTRPTTWYLLFAAGLLTATLFGLPFTWAGVLILTGLAALVFWLNGVLLGDLD